MISPSALADIAEYVPLTAGTIELFKHYLPRLLEIVITDGFPNDWPDLPVQLSRLAWGNGERAAAWWDWPTAERTAVQQFLDALWAERRRGDLVSADETLSGIAMAVPNLQPFLESWNRDPNEDAIATLHHRRPAALVARTQRLDAQTNERTFGDPTVNAVQSRARPTDADL